jgi:hypothetical protein
MTDQEIKEQIERDAKAVIDKEYGERSSWTEAAAIWDDAYHNRVESATSQDKIATNRTVEAAIAIIVRLRPLTGPEIIKELEKLRR